MEGSKAGVNPKEDSNPALGMNEDWSSESGSDSNGAVVSNPKVQLETKKQPSESDSEESSEYPWHDAVDDCDVTKYVKNPL